MNGPQIHGGGGQDIQIAVQQGEALRESPVVFCPFTEVRPDRLAVTALASKLSGSIVDLLRRTDNDNLASGFRQCLGHAVTKAFGPPVTMALRPSMSNSGCMDIPPCNDAAGSRFCFYHITQV